MDYPLTRLAAGATAAYNVFVLAKPDSLVRGLDGQIDLATAKKLSRVWAARDLPVALAVIAGPETARTAGAGARVLGDLSDAAYLATRTKGRARLKALGVTIGWAALNSVCHFVDRKLLDKSRVAVTPF